MSDWVLSDGRSLYRNADGQLIDLTDAPPDMVADMVRARREERERNKTNKLKENKNEKRRND